MPCAEFADLLSAHYDGELPSDREAAVAAHVASCPDCLAEINLLRKLSELTTQLDEPSPPREVWRSIEKQLETEIADIGKTISWRSRIVSRKKTLVLTVLLMLGMSLVAYFVVQTHEHQHIAINLGPFMDVFERAPKDAQEHLVATYSGRRVGFDEAVNKLKYRPVAADGLPHGYELSEANLLQMPCCKCLEVCYRRKHGGLSAYLNTNEINSSGSEIVTCHRQYVVEFQLA